MTSITHDNPLREALSLRHAIDQLFEQSFIQPMRLLGFQTTLTPLNIYETDHSYQVQVALPGVKPEDIELTVQTKTLRVRGEYHSETGTDQHAQETQQGRQGSWLVHEIRTGSFERSVTFDRPVDAEKVEASYEHGVLTISLPFSAASRSRRIPIKGSTTPETDAAQRMGSTSKEGLPLTEAESATTSWPVSQDASLSGIEPERNREQNVPITEGDTPIES